MLFRSRLWEAVGAALRGQLGAEVVLQADGTPITAQELLGQASSSQEG